LPGLCGTNLSFIHKSENFGFGDGVVQNRRNPSPKTTIPKEKLRSVDVAHDGVLPSHRNSWGSGDDKRWRT